MSSHGKSIGRIQSAPPDEGEPDLKSTLNLNAQEFNPLAIVKPVVQSKGLSAQASDFVPDMQKPANAIPSQAPLAYQPGRSQAKKPYISYQSNYSGHYQPHYNQFMYPSHQPYVAHHGYHAGHSSHSQPIQSTLQSVPSAPTPSLPANPPTASISSFSFNADTPSFELNFSAKEVINIPDFEFKPSTQPLENFETKPSEDNSRAATEEKTSIEEENKNQEENSKVDENLAKDVKFDDILSGMEKTIKDLEDFKDDKEKKTLDDQPESISLSSDLKTEKDLIETESISKLDSSEVESTPSQTKTEFPAAESPKSPERPAGPVRRVYDLENIKNFKLDFRKDPNFLIVPDSISKFCNRIVEETRALKRGGKNQDDKKITREVTQKLVWRKAKTAEEQKISEKAKAYTRKFTSTVAEQEKIKKDIKSTLNKLSPNNLQKLTQSILETCKKSHDCLKLVVSGIFEKAWSEKKYTQMYSDICKTLKSGLEGYRYPDIDPAKLPDTRNYFKYELLYMCEETFNKNHQEEIPATLTDEQRLDRLSKLKEKTLGNVRFIGELFNVNLITAKIVLECVTGLLDLFESENNQDRLEGACLLLQTGGASFERSKLLQETNLVYERLTVISSKDINSKNRFKIMDLKEFRESGWKNHSKEGLKKVEEIHADHMMEQEEIKRRHGYNN